MNIEFTSEEAGLLKEMVEERIRELGPEIHHTDNRAYRVRLQEMRSKLATLLEHLQRAAA